MGQLCCKGIPACWINGWLAAVGATVLDRRLRLHWTEGDNLAVLSAADCDPVDALVESWPNEDLLNDLPIARHWKDMEVLPLNAPIDSFGKRVQEARRQRHPYVWTLSSTLTDLSLKKDGVVAPAPFYAPMPGGVVLQERLLDINGAIRQPIRERVQNSLDGVARRAQIYGLGFDQAKIGSLADETEPWVDPVMEMMAFFGLALLPVRGDGRASDYGGRQRGWRKQKKVGSRGYDSFFCWPAWRQPLNADGIDALLDVWNPDKAWRWPSVGVHAAWRSAEYEVENKNDPTRAYGAERL